MEQEDPTKSSKTGATSSNNKEAKNTKQLQGTRKRVSQACDKCRSRKDKCDGKRPSCSTCLTHGRTCSYDTNVKKRGLPEGYVRGIEKLWGLTIREVEGVEDEILSVFNVSLIDSSISLSRMPNCSLNCAILIHWGDQIFGRT